MFSAEETRKAKTYISDSWKVLTRTFCDLPKALNDPKVSDGLCPLYVPQGENIDEIRKKISASWSADGLQIYPVSSVKEHGHGLLYLPHAYVVPGGRFNEMYGWDSYFILLGLLKSGLVQEAKGMVENHIYQVIHYGAVLNANRTYYLTRSQPPFLTQMVLEVFRRTQDLEWLRSTLPAIRKYHSFLTSAPHLVPSKDESSVLSRYYDLASGPCFEVCTGESDSSGKTHYDRVREFYRAEIEKATSGTSSTNPLTSAAKLRSLFGYDVNQFYDYERDELTQDFYEGDRAMRASGFDPSFRFGHFNAACAQFAPVCLNSLLYVMERDMCEILRNLGTSDEEGQKEAAEWEQCAKTRQTLIQTLMWDESLGLFLDFNFVDGKRREYPFATTFFPLWAGLCTPEQAERVATNLHIFERDGGLLTSPVETGCQWDSPFGWAPTTLIAVQGLLKYGHTVSAHRIANKFTSTVLDFFLKDGTMVEKYNVVAAPTRFLVGFEKETSMASSDKPEGAEAKQEGAVVDQKSVQDSIKFGYVENVVGFGWTNAAVLEFLEILGFSN